MSPEECIAGLDSSLETAGNDVILRRVYGQGTNIVNADVGLRAGVSSYQPVELVGGIAQTDSRVIISPTGIAKAQWPGGELPSATVADPTLPRRNDKMIIDGRLRTIEVVDPKKLQGVLVRIEIRVLG